jgi:hypothetical protein
MRWKTSGFLLAAVVSLTSCSGREQPTDSAVASDHAVREGLSSADGSPGRCKDPGAPCTEGEDSGCPIWACVCQDRSGAKVSGCRVQGQDAGPSGIARCASLVEACTEHCAPRGGFKEGNGTRCCKFSPTGECLWKP